jgi:hypothetical protein
VLRMRRTLAKPRPRRRRNSMAIPAACLSPRDAFLLFIAALVSLGLAWLGCIGECASAQCVVQQRIHVQECGLLRR